MEKLDPVSSATINMARDYDGPTGFDQRPFVRDLKIPTLYLQGEADFFSSFDLVREEFELMKESGADVASHSYEGVNMGFRITISGVMSASESQGCLNRQVPRT